MELNKQNRIGIIEAITSPLGFFALGLLIIESFLGLVLTVSNIPPQDILWGLLMGVLLFILDLYIVAYIAWNKPEHLIFDKETLMERTKLESSVSIEVTHSNDGDEVDALSSSDLINQFLFPEGNPNQTRKQKVKEWLESQGLTDISIPFFLSASIYNEAKSKMIRELNISDGGNNHE